MQQVTIRGNDPTVYAGRYKSWSVHLDGEMVVTMFGPQSAFAAMAFAEALEKNAVPGIMRLERYTKCDVS